MRCAGSSRRWDWRPSRRRGGPPPPPDPRAVAPPAAPPAPSVRRPGGRVPGLISLTSRRLAGPSAARYTPPTVMTRRPTVMTRRLAGHQAVWRGQERAFSLPTFLLLVGLALEVLVLSGCFSSFIAPDSAARSDQDVAIINNRWGCPFCVRSIRRTEDDILVYEASRDGQEVHPLKLMPGRYRPLRRIGGMY